MGPKHGLNRVYKAKMGLITSMTAIIGLVGVDFGILLYQVFNSTESIQLFHEKPVVLIQHTYDVWNS